jgi:hypothetical protein
MDQFTDHFDVVTGDSSGSGPHNRQRLNEPCHRGVVTFLMKDIVLFSASAYLLRQDLMRVSSPARQNRESSAVVQSH